jgi:hypothetical protein
MMLANSAEKTVFMCFSVSIESWTLTQARAVTRLPWAQCRDGDGVLHHQL